MSRVLLMQGNQAVVEGAIAAGVRFYGGYPITPSTEIAEGMAKRLPRQQRETYAAKAASPPGGSGHAAMIFLPDSRNPCRKSAGIGE